MAAASFGILAPGVKLTGYNETIVGPGLHREIEPKAEVLTGLDVLAEDNFAPRRETNRAYHQPHRDQPRREAQCRSDAGLRNQNHALFSPEHGLTGTEDQENIAGYERSRFRIYSFQPLSGPFPPDYPTMLDRRGRPGFRYTGCRRALLHLFLHHALQHGGSRQAPFALLPAGPAEPVTGVHVEGPMLDRDLESFVGCLEIPLRHGMTLGNWRIWRIASGILD